MFLVALFNATKDIEGLLYGRFFDNYRLESSLKSRIPFNMLTVIIECCRAYALQFTSG
jgi:hypothetical protein